MIILRIFFSLIVFLGLALFGYCGYLFFINIHLPRDLTSLSPAHFDKQYESVTITTSDNLSLAGWFIPAQKYRQGDDPLPAIVVCHGLGTNKSDLVELAAALSDNYHVLLFDFRGHGYSEGNKLSLGYHEQIDLKSAISYLVLRKEVNSQFIGVFGLSMGAATAILAGSEDKRVKAIVADSSYTSLWSQAGREIGVNYQLPSFPVLYISDLFYRFTFSRSMCSISPLDAVASFAPRPILFIAGEKDERMTVEDAKQLYDAARQPKELFIVMGAEHGEGLSVGGETYKKKVKGFFDRHLTGK